LLALLLLLLPRLPQLVRRRRSSPAGGDKAAAVPPAAVSEADRTSRSRIALICGKVLEVAPHPDSDKLYVEKIDIGEPSPRTIISGLRDYINMCESGIPPFAAESNSATCTWCGGSSGTCVDYACRCAPCASFTSPDVCVTATDPNYSGQNCAWCQGSCKSLLECTPCRVFRSMGECFNNTSPSLPYPSTCEWCNSKCSDNCCAVEDPNTDCTDRVVETGDGKIGCRWCGNPDELPPTCAPIGSCSN
jgi:hypothetical protein